MTDAGQRASLPPSDGVNRPVPTGGGQRFRSAIAKLAGLGLLAIVVTALIASGGLGATDPEHKAQQVAAGSVALLGAVLMVIGLLRARSSARGDVLHLPTLRSASLVLVISVVLAWGSLVLLWILGVTGGDESDTSLFAGVLTLPLAFAAVMATVVWRVVARVLRGEAQA